MVRGTSGSNATQGAKSWLFHVGFYDVLRRLLPSGQVAILRYHAVCEPAAGYADPGICISPAAFERQMEYLAANYRVLSLPDVVSALRRGSTLPRNTVVITFDDGYADNLGAARVLARLGINGTFYITAGCLADGQPFWPSELRALINAIHEPAIELDLGDGLVTLPLWTAAERQAAVRRLTRAFKAGSIPRREALRDGLRRYARMNATPSSMLSWEDVVAMHRMGMVIGSHTMTHPNLPNAGLDAARAEIVDSKAALEERLNAPVTMFSYPNGGAERYMTRAIARLVEEAGYEAATTSRNGFAKPGSDLFALERVQVAERMENLVFALEVERFAFKPKPRPGELQ